MKSSRKSLRKSSRKSLRKSSKKSSRKSYSTYTDVVSIDNMKNLKYSLYLYNYDVFKLSIDYMKYDDGYVSSLITNLI